MFNSKVVHILPIKILAAPLVFHMHIKFRPPPFPGLTGFRMGICQSLIKLEDIKLFISQSEKPEQRQRVKTIRGKEEGNFDPDTKEHLLFLVQSLWAPLLYKKETGTP